LKAAIYGFAAGINKTVPPAVKGHSSGLLQFRMPRWSIRPFTTHLKDRGKRPIFLKKSPVFGKNPVFSGQSHGLGKSMIALAIQSSFERHLHQRH